MDEPFGALDNITRSKIQTEFKELDDLKKKTIVMVTHDVQEAFTLGDRICLMDKGKIIQIGTPTDLLFKPANDFVKNFLKDQRLQLEFKTIRIKDIWTFLPETKATDNGSAISINADVWTGLQSFSEDKSSHLHITHQHETRSVRFDQLMSAFHKYQSHRAHE